MKKRLCELVVILLVIFFLSSNLVFANTINSGIVYNNVGYVSGQLILEDSNLDDIFIVPVTPGEVHDGYIFQLIDGAVVSCDEHENIRVLFAPENLFHAATIQDIINFVPPELIVFVSPDYIVSLGPFYTREHIPPTFTPHAFASVSDPDYHHQWGLEFIRGAAAWSTNDTPSTSGVVVAVIDSGICIDHINHQDLNSVNILPGRNFVAGEDVNSPADDSGHGTMVTGVIAAIRNNEVGIASMACGVSVLPLRVMHMRGEELPVSHSAAISAIGYAVDNGANIINMSLGFPVRTPGLESAINHAANNNVWMIASAGNDGDSRIQYPAGFNDVIGVGAITPHGNRTDFSNHNSSVFITAPGTGIITTYMNNSHIWIDGTSFSAPKITALAAIARGYHPNMTKDTFRDLLRNSVIPRGSQGRCNQYGYGIIDVGLFMYNLTSRDFFNFTDVSQGHWARNEVWENARYGLMHGRVGAYARGAYHGSHRNFQPNSPMWRLEFTMALGRLHELNGGSIPWVSSSFADVNTWGHFPYNYSRYVHWAQQNNIVEGVGNNLFHPGHVVTRQATAVFFYRYTRFLAESCPVIRAQFNAVFTPGFNPTAILRERFPDTITRPRVGP